MPPNPKPETKSSPTIYLFERGINGWQGVFGDWNNWPNAAIAWLHHYRQADGTDPGYRGQTLLYFVTALFAGLTRTRRARQLAMLLKQYNEGADGTSWRIVIVAHSEGTATTLKALQLADYPYIAELHLLCGAVSGNCRANGINTMLHRGAVGKIFCYLAGQDSAMRIESTLLGKLCFLIGLKDEPLGLRGPQDCAAGTDTVKTIWSGRWINFEHSSCFLPHNFADTMREIVSGSAFPVPSSELLSPLASALNSALRVPNSALSSLNPKILSPK